MALFKKLLLLAVLAVTCPSVLHGMAQETAEEILQRSQQSGYVSSAHKGIDKNTAQGFSNPRLINHIQASDWNSVAESIVAGCNPEHVFNDPTVTEDNIATICKNLKEILDNQKNSWNTNETDYRRITNFLQHGLNSKKMTRNNFLAWFPPNTKHINVILGPLQDPPLPSNINIYKILLPVTAVITVLAIAYTWWSKQGQEADAVDEIDGQNPTNDKDEIAQTPQ